MKCFNCNQYTPMGSVYALHLKNTYHICESCVAKAIGESPVGVGKIKRKEREIKNLKFYHTVMEKLSKYEPIIF